MTDERGRTSEPGAPPQAGDHPMRLKVALGVAIVLVVFAAFAYVLFVPRAVVSSSTGALSLTDLQSKWQVLGTISNMVSSAVKGQPDYVVRHIDSTSVVTGVVKDLFADPALHAALYRYTPDRTSDGTEAVRARAEALFDEELPEHIKSGTLPKRIKIPFAGRTFVSLVASTYARNAVRSVDVDGDTAIVTAEAPYGGKRISVKVKFVRSDGEWIITGVENLPEVARAAGY